MTTFHPIKPISHVFFTPMNGEQIQNFGIKISKPYSHNSPSTEDTPADERLGDKNKCNVCSSDHCPGHFGYIDLAVPMWNPMYIKHAINVLKCFCIDCSKLFAPEFYKSLKSEGQARLLEYREKSEKVKRCDECGSPRYKISENTKTGQILYGESELSAQRVYEVFKKITNDDLVKIGMNKTMTNEMDTTKISLAMGYIHPHQVRPEAFIITSLIVIPIQNRPHIIQNGERKEDTLTELYNAIIKTNTHLALKCGRTDIVEAANGGVVGEKKRGGKSKKTAEELIVTLQKLIYQLIDSKKVKGVAKSGAGNGDHKINSLNERVSGKQGHIQSNAGGKRSDQSARDVIVSAGPGLSMDQFGIPRHIAETVTVPEVITPWNVDYFNEKLFTRKYTCVRCYASFETRKDKNAHLARPGMICENLPGDFHIEEKIIGRGILTSINRGRGIQDLKILTANFTKPLVINGVEGLRPGDKVERFVQDDDWVYANRQPTISIESIQGFRVKVLTHGELIFQLPPPVTRGFNADYDGADF